MDMKRHMLICSLVNRWWMLVGATKVCTLTGIESNGIKLSNGDHIV
jgi:hypothetical protein